jgi:predicted HTH transcriptional regulator
VIRHHPRDCCERVVAFANTAGGIVLVAVEDGTRHVRGVADPLALDEPIASLITDSIAPRLLPNLEILSYRKTQVKAGMDAGTYVRVGSTNRRADAALTAEMQRFARGEAFDERAMPDIDSEALSFRASSESFAAIRRLTRRDLQTPQLLTNYRGRTVPTPAASCCLATTGCKAFQMPGFRPAASTALIERRLPIARSSTAPRWQASNRP